MNFHDIRMPEFIESFTVGRAEFATSCVATLSGREVRNWTENILSKDIGLKAAGLAR